MRICALPDMYRLKNRTVSCVEGIPHTHTKKCYTYSAVRASSAARVRAFPATAARRECVQD